jgi:hypothetical protein
MPRSVIALGFLSLSLTVSGLAVPAAWSADEPVPGKAQPGWPDVFVSRKGYIAAYEKPVVGKGEKPQTYRQKATYLWSGGRADRLEVTLARDPAFKDTYSAEALKKEPNPPRELENNKKKAWLWEFQRDRFQRDQIAGRLVVLLDADKAIIFEQKDSIQNLEAAAREFDFARIEKVLADPPKQ